MPQIALSVSAFYILNCFEATAVGPFSSNTIGEVIDEATAIASALSNAIGDVTLIDIEFVISLSNQQRDTMPLLRLL